METEKEVKQNQNNPMETTTSILNVCQKLFCRNSVKGGINSGFPCLGHDH